MSNKQKKAKFLLEDLDVREVSLVSKPAIGRTYLLTKAAEDSTNELLLEESADNTETTEAGTPPATMGVDTMNEQLVELLKSVELDDEARAAITGALDIILSNKGTVPVEVMKSFYVLVGYEVPQEIVEKEKIVEKIVEVEKAVETTVDDKEEILKGLDDRTVALFKDQEKRIEQAETAIKAAEKAAKAEKDARVAKDFVQKAAKDYPTLPVTAETLGPVLKAISEKLNEAEGKVVLDIFNTAKEVATITKQDTELGISGAGSGDVTTDEPQYVKKAKAMVEKGEAETEAQAISKLYSTEPTLFMGD